MFPESGQIITTPLPSPSSFPLMLLTPGKSLLEITLSATSELTLTPTPQLAQQSGRDTRQAWKTQIKSGSRAKSSYKM